jgi:hypothetical protein
LIAGRNIICEEKDRDRYGRIVAICRASGEDIGAIMVRARAAAFDYRRAMVDRFPGKPFSFGALRKTFGPPYLRCDICPGGSPHCSSGRTSCATLDYR